MATSSAPDRLNRIDGEQVIGDEKEESKRDGEKRESEEERDGEKQESEETRDGEMKESEEESDGGKQESEEESDGDEEESEEESDGDEQESEEESDGDEEGIMMNAGGDSEDTDEDEVQRYWDCCQCTYRTENDVKNKRCKECLHRRCTENCMEYMEDEDGIYDNASNVIQNTEAEKVARFPSENCIQEGPSRTGWELKLFKGNARKKFRQVPLESMIPIYVETMDLFDKPRTIRAVWNHKDEYWTYRSWIEINKIPWAWMFNKGFLRGAIQSRKIYHPAPPVGKHDFPFFNYATDTLYLDYGRCGTDEIEQENLIEAMTIAGEALKKHQSNPNNPKLRFLQVTYCPFIEVVEDVLDCFKDVRTLERVILRWHNHYDLNGADYNTDWWNVHLAIHNGALKGNPWPTVMENHTGYPIIRREGPFA